VTSTQIVTASGETGIKVHSTTEQDFPLVQVLDDAHKLGCHHIVIDRDTSTRAVSVGFAGEVKVWANADGKWKDDGEIEVGSRKQAGETWAICLSSDGKFVVGTTHDGRVNVWDLGDTGSRQKIREFETKGSFGMSIDMVCYCAHCQFWKTRH
jgi:superkiller protein 8